MSKIESGWNFPRPKPVDQTDRWKRRLKKAMTYARDERIALDDYERAELARMIPGVDMEGEGSWKDLTEDQLTALIWMLEGYIWIRYMIEQR